MAVPVASGQSSNNTAAGSYTSNLPVAAPAIGDRAFLVIVHRDTALGTPTPSDTAGFGPWTQVPSSPVVQGAAQLTVWTSVVESTSPTAPVVSDSGDHQQSRLFYVSHVDGTPEVHVVQSSVDATSDTSGVATGPTTTRPDCLVFLFAASDTPDANGTAEFSAVANAGLTSVAELADNSVQTGGGSAKLIASGQKIAAGAIANWTYTKANAGVKAQLVVAVSPPVTGGTTYFGEFSLDMTLDREFDGHKTTFGEFDFPITVTADFDAVRETFGQFSLPLTFDRDFAAIKETFGQFSLPLTFDAVFEAVKETFGEFEFPIIFDAEFDGSVSVGPQTKFGEFSLDLSLDPTFSAIRETFGQFSIPIAVDGSFEGARETFSAFSLPLIFDSTIGPGRVTTFGAFDLQLMLDINFVGFAEFLAIILNNAEALYLGDVEVERVYVGTYQAWP